MLKSFKYMMLGLQFFVKSWITIVKAAFAPILTGGTNMIPIWQENFTVRFSDVDRSNRITLAAVFDYFQEAAINHAEELGVGREAMANTGVAWILSRITARIERRPHFGEKITVRTWPRGAEKLFVVRDYDIFDANSGVLLAKGRSNWLVVDIQKRHPLRPNTVMDKLPLNEGLDALPNRVINLETRGELVQTGERYALYSDIDLNDHVNNTRYVQWIQDGAAASLLESAERLRLDVAYLQEIKLGECTELWQTALGEGVFAFEGRQSGIAVFRSELHIG
jgi:acyl-ACP thioesterase